MSDEKYCYPPDFTVLINKFGHQDAESLDQAERLAVRVRMEQGAPTGNFDLQHLQAIHGHLFQDVYEWAGQIREVEIAKGGHQFQPRKFIETGMADIHRRLEQKDFLQGLDLPAFAQEAGQIIGDVNYVHPFREGNGRTQAIYMQQLGQQAGHGVDLSRLKRDEWIQASIDSHSGKYDRMSAAIESSIRSARHTPDFDNIKTKTQERRSTQERSNGHEEDL